MAFYFTPSGRLLALITRAHIRLYEATDGRVGAWLPQLSEGRSRFPVRRMHALLLTTRGRKTGLARTVALPYFDLAGRRILVASFAGNAKNPAWYDNLCANPRVRVRVGRDTADADAEVLTGDERERFFALLTEQWPRYAVYQAKTERTIPLVALVPVGDAAIRT